MGVTPLQIEIYSYEAFTRGLRTPGYASPEDRAIPTMLTQGVEYDRIDEDDGEVFDDLPGRLKYANGCPTVARTIDNAEIKGVLLMDFRPGLIEVPGTTGIGAFVAHIPSDVTIEAPVPFGMVGWMAGVSI